MWKCCFFILCKTQQIRCLWQLQNVVISEMLFWCKAKIVLSAQCMFPKSPWQVWFRSRCRADECSIIKHGATITVHLVLNYTLTLILHLTDSQSCCCHGWWKQWNTMQDDKQGEKPRKQPLSTVALGFSIGISVSVEQNLPKLLHTIEKI